MSDSGFLYATDRDNARRRFELSCRVVVLLGMAIVAAALSLVPFAVSDRGYAAFLAGSALHAERLVLPDVRS